MKKYFILISLFLIYLNGFNFHIDINGIDTSKNGKIILNIFNKKNNSFPEKPDHKRVLSAKNRQISITLRDISKGEYAVFILHDENQNGVLDRTFFDLYPIEGYGYSNNYKFFPSFKKSQVNINSDTSIKIKVVY
jgi:uncharacterized protein (DUF2141 family)